ncbi:MAG: hypothetical protein Q4G40_08985, partial [Brachybacterium sp.]|nr:hypothetical protein [Brachybacterium sp.]
MPYSPRRASGSRDAAVEVHSSQGRTISTFVRDEVSNFVQGVGTMRIPEFVIFFLLAIGTLPILGGHLGEALLVVLVGLALLRSPIHRMG